MAVKEAKEKSVVSFSRLERTTDTDWHTTDNWINPLNIAVGEDGGITNGGERAGKTKCCSAARSTSLCSPTAVVIHTNIKTSQLFFHWHCGFAKALTVAHRSMSRSQQPGFPRCSSHGCNQCTSIPRRKWPCSPDDDTFINFYSPVLARIFLKCVPSFDVFFVIVVPHVQAESFHSLQRLEQSFQRV